MIASTKINAAIISILGSISLPLIFMSDEKLIMPAEDMGIDTFSCLNDIMIGLDTNTIKAFGA